MQGSFATEAKRENGYRYLVVNRRFDPDLAIALNRSRPDHVHWSEARATALPPFAARL